MTDDTSMTHIDTRKGTKMHICANTSCMAFRSCIELNQALEEFSSRLTYLARREAPTEGDLVVGWLA